MISLPVSWSGRRLSVLCLGAHADDIEIGAGGAILSWIGAGLEVQVDWCVLSAEDRRAAEAAASASAFLDGAAAKNVRLASFPDNRFPSHSDEIKSWLLGLREEIAPHIVLTHHRQDAHQDHREIAQLTWSLFRDHLILEYEIPKWDGDLAQPNVYMPLTGEVLQRKIELLLCHYRSQSSKDWFDAETFRGLARLRGVECRAPQGWAEAFVGRKLTIG